MIGLRVVPTDELSRAELRTLREVLDRGFQDAFEGGFTDDDWAHTIGGTHVMAVEDEVVSHASVVERQLMAGDRSLRTGYVEGVVTVTSRRNRGHASRVMEEVGRIIARDYELGALSTALPDFYARLGWQRWRGPTYARSPDGPIRTADEDDGIMFLRTSVTANLDPTVPLTCDWRSGDLW